MFLNIAQQHNYIASCVYVYLSPKLWGYSLIIQWRARSICVYSQMSVWFTERNIMRRGTLFVLLFIVLAAVIVGGSALLRSQPAIELRLAVDPLAETWVREMAVRFNDTGETIGVGRRVRISVEVISDVNVLDPSHTWAADEQPDGWIASWSELAKYYTPGFGITRKTLNPSLARTALVWMSPVSRASSVSELSWPWVQEAAADNLLQIAFALPRTTSQGLAVLLSAIADSAQDSVLSASTLNNSQIRAALMPVIASVPNFNSVGADVAVYVAGARGGSVDVAIAPESQWLTQLNTLRQRGELRFAYPNNLVVFDFPLIALVRTEADPAREEGIQAFGVFLSAQAQQQAAFTYGLRPALAEPDPNDSVFVQAQRFGIAPTLSAGTLTLPDSYNAVQSLISWFNQQQ